MTYTPVAIQHEVAALVEPLHDSLAAARLHLRENYAGIYRPSDQGWLRTHCLRGLVYCELEVRDLGGWILADGHARNGQVHLTSADGALRVRLLRDGQDQMTPPAGHNPTRRAYYSNSLFPAGDDLFGKSDHGLLLLWNEDPDDDAADCMVRLVRPLEPGRFGRRLRADMDIDLPRTKSDFLSLRFDVHDEDLWYGIADEEKGDGAN